MATIVCVKNPLWYQKETSSDQGTYVIIRRYGFNQHTECSLQDGTKIQASDASEGSLYGWYECRFYRADPSAIAKKQRTIKYEKDNTTLQTAIGLSALLAIAACFLGK